MDREYFKLVKQLFELCGNNYTRTAQSCGLTTTHVHKVLNGQGPAEAKPSSVRKVTAAIVNLTRPMKNLEGSTAGFISVKTYLRIKTIDDFLIQNPEYIDMISEELKKYGFTESSSQEPVDE